MAKLLPVIPQVFCFSFLPFCWPEKQRAPFPIPSLVVPFKPLQAPCPSQGFVSLPRRYAEINPRKTRWELRKLREKSRFIKEAKLPKFFCGFNPLRMAFPARAHSCAHLWGSWGAGWSRSITRGVCVPVCVLRASPLSEQQDVPHQPQR